MWTKRRIAILALVAAGLSRPALAAPARTTEMGPGSIYPKDSYPTELVKRPLTLSESAFQLGFGMNFNLSTDLVGKPVNIPLEVGYGITPGIELDVFSSTGFCITGESNGCLKVFDDIGARGVFSLVRETGFMVVGTVGLEALRLSDPSAMQGQIGVGGKLNVDSFSMVGTLLMGFGLNNRDLGNKEVLAFVLEPQLQLAPQFALYATTGFNSVLDQFSDVIQVPLGVGALFVPSPPFDLGVEFTFANLLGKNGGTDFRSGRVYAQVRF